LVTKRGLRIVRFLVAINERIMDSVRVMARSDISGSDASGKKP
jgi:hypothetical protein